METYLNMGYEYACSCLLDVKNLKKSLGISGASAEVFSSCSESGNNAKAAQEAARAAKELALKIAAEKALALAARNKIIKDTVAAMKGITGSNCDSLAVTANVETCYTAVKKYSDDFDMVHKMRTTAFVSSGGATSTKNKTQKDALTNADSTRQGILDGGKYFRTASTTYDLRFTEEGVLTPSCRV